MTDDEQTLLLELSKVVYAMGMKAIVNGKPLLAAIQKLDPEYQPPAFRGVG